MKPKLEEILKSYEGATRDQLIPILQEVQEAEGFLSKSSLEKIAAVLNISPAKTYGVASFYNQFRFQGPGLFHVQVCRGTACHVKGSRNVLESIQKELKIEAGQTTKDGLFSLEVVACIGACGLAPVIAVAGEFHAGVSPEKIPGILSSYKERALAHG